MPTRPWFRALALASTASLAAGVPLAQAQPAPARPAAAATPAAPSSASPPVAAVAPTITDAAAAPSAVWDLTRLYPTDAAWEAERQALLAELPQLTALRGTLGRDAASLQRGLERLSQTERRLERLQVYAYALGSTDGREARNQERLSLARSVVARNASATAWLEPEVQALGAARVEAFQRAAPGLKPHAKRLADILRRAPHTLGGETEAALAAMAPALGGPSNAYSLLATLDMPWPTIQVEGQPVKVNQTGYQRLREHPDRAVREAAFAAFWQTFGQYRNTFGATLGAKVEAGVTDARLRQHASAVGASLAANAIPEAVYRTLVAEANKSLPTLHRSFKLRQKLLKLPELRYHDIYPPLVKLDRSFPLADAASLTLDAVAPLGRDYQAALKQALAERSMHAYPAEGKQSGAYQTSVYGLTPLVFLNHQDSYDGVSTFAHEWGHGMHTVLADRAQPFETAGYPLFVAEIAAITNEVLLSDLMRARSRSKDERLYYLGHALEQMRGTYFRQTMFAEFELATHDAVQRGEALSGPKMTALYCDLLKKYHGAEAGVMTIDEAYCAEWAYIPHFYRPFYVYQYATSMAAASHFAEQLQAGDAALRERYLDVLRAGGSVDPYPLLKKAGLDMATPQPYRALERRMNAVMDEMEKLLAEG